MYVIILSYLQFLLSGKFKISSLRFWDKLFNEDEVKTIVEADLPGKSLCKCVRLGLPEERLHLTPFLKTGQN